VTDGPPGGASGGAPGSGPAAANAYAEYIAPAPASASMAGTAAGTAAGTPPRKRRPPWRAAFFALAGVAIIAGVAWALLGDRVFVVRSISVTGTHLVSPAQVLAAADIPPGTPLMRVNPGAVTRRVENIPKVESVKVTEGWPDHLTIAVTERVPVLAVRMEGGGYDLVDPAGVIVLYEKTKPSGLPLFVTTLSGSALQGDPGVAAAGAVLRELTPALARTVATVSAQQLLNGAGSAAAAEQVTLSLKGGKTVVWGAPGNSAAKNREIQILFRDRYNYLDVSAPGTAVAR
jgi:cell division protein FtsQ